MATCCLVAVPWCVSVKVRQARTRRELAAASFDGVMTGLGIGLALATGIFLAVSAVANLDP